MSDSPELAAIRARVNEPPFASYGVYGMLDDCRALLRMLDEAHKRLEFLEEMGVECVNDWYKIETLATERDEARAEIERLRAKDAESWRINNLAAEKIDALTAENERLRETLRLVRESVILNDSAEYDDVRAATIAIDEVLKHGSDG